MSNRSGQSISNLPGNQLILLAGQFGDVSIGESKTAPFNAYQRQHDPTCLPDTPVDLLQEIYNWADGQDERHIFWVTGLAGTGKSTIARTAARTYSDQNHLSAIFYFSRGGGDIGHWQQLVLRPLSKLDENNGQSAYVLVVDALDECDNDNDIRIILHLLAEARSLKTVRLRVFLTSRSEVPIRNGFVQIPDVVYQDFIFRKISLSIVGHDIRTFLRHELERIARRHYLGAGWPGEQIVKQLVDSANGLFIWAATACRFISEGKLFAGKRLNIILEHSSSAISGPEKVLNEIYGSVLRNCISSEYSDEEAKKLRSMLKTLLGSIVTTLSPFYPVLEQATQHPAR
ncbi:hypothetical protein P152DRAFT_450280 [Eremomyces bilateralis CBS 781.70]|uniref:Nephrocystin 3-like N-terminal domain-containing protein n=1 Tax=Eremomyces bilateralis CBS 781.70 TaxID=1392243 RepID=A0A6G1G0E6_9PEZI|nr:uncharacterized protein P152DRAFT_450280 [Eremomyces bilateralis CBS 781.70]KAF1811587.1 hypothetical protein P152DRAFT_450280 [Eremomyces bilateralis CBS 781.70]